MCFLQIQSVQVCGIKRVIIQTTDFLQIKAYTVKKANVFSFALCGLIYSLFSFSFFINLVSHISPQKVNSIKCCKIKWNQVFIYHCYSRLLSELSPFSWCLAFDMDVWTWKQSENKIKEESRLSSFNLITKHCAFMKIYLLSYPISWIKTQSDSCWECYNCPLFNSGICFVCCGAGRPVWGSLTSTSSKHLIINWLGQAAETFCWEFLSAGRGHDAIYGCTFGALSGALCAWTIANI